jgi:hypothetical protein
MRMRFLVAVSVGCLLLTGQPARAHDSDTHPSDYTYGPGSGNWNGWRIYLSPAHHWGGPKYGCGNYVEDDNMPLVAIAAATYSPTPRWDLSLTGRGYRVHVGRGDPDDNVDSADAWGADRYIALHSNASGSAQCGGSGRGTRVFYKSGSAQGEELAMFLAEKVGSASPGTPDYHTTHTFYEITQPNAKTAYLETEFHDWTTGKNWLVSYEEWSWRIGYAVDEHLGYPGG